MDKKSKEIKYKLVVMECNYHGDVKYSIGNVVNNTPITMYSFRWV